ncbi:hypothetical protein A0H81_05335 [Grifola frondosa]|uniref:Uncharacterized protein n=1 Tax=Grifola frondosa TaxID=5627 RepID=A0A1C7MHJ5_GRIFR|nr:hypothetical protein A0H81_05335 [Grifola frondosa]
MYSRPTPREARYALRQASLERHAQDVRQPVTHDASDSSREPLPSSKSATAPRTSTAPRATVPPCGSAAPLAIAPPPPPSPPSPLRPATLPSPAQISATMSVTTSTPSCTCTCTCTSCRASSQAATPAIKYDFPIVPLCTPWRVRPCVPFMVFGYALTIDEILDYGERHGLSDNSGILNLSFVLTRKICGRMPDGKRCIAYVRRPDKYLATCFVIASNKNAGHLERVNDGELVKLMQEILGTDSFPEWYKVQSV